MTATESELRAARLGSVPLDPIGVSGGFVGGTLASLKDIWAHRQLMGLLIRRELKVRYKDSSLGFAWSLIRPLAMLAVYYVAVGKFLGAQRAIPDFAIYVFTGLTAWSLFSEILASSTSSILSNAGLVKKIYLPREVFPLSVVGSAMFNFAIQVAILLAATAAVGQFPSGSRWVYLPLSLAVLLLYGMALGLVLAALNVYLRDVQYLVEIGLTVWFWTTPTVYSWALVQDALGDHSVLEQIYLANPAAVAVLGLQRTFWVAGTDAPVPENLATRLAIMAGIGFILLWLAQRIFARLEGNFAQEL